LSFVLIRFFGITINGGNSTCPPGLPDISNNVGCQTLFDKTYPSAPESGLVGSVTLIINDHRLVRNLAVGFSPTHTSVRSNFDHDYFSNSLCRERDAHSNGRCSTSRHVRYRAVPRTNRTSLTANSPNRFATSSTTEPPICAPSLPWQCSCVDASPSECTDVATPHHTRRTEVNRVARGMRRSGRPCLTNQP
jgi:hypothetical protein